MASLELEVRLDNLLSTAQAETADIDLYAPIAEREECPICLVALPIKENEIVFMPCCGKSICDGCNYKQMLNDSQNGTEEKCAFCRQPNIRSDTKRVKSLRKLMKKDNRGAFLKMAESYRIGVGVFQSDTKSLEMIIRAAELGNPNAYTIIGSYYEEGLVVEENLSKSLEFYEVGAKKGSIGAHHELAIIQHRRRNYELMLKHFEVLASAGCEESMNGLMKYYKDGILTKEKLAETLRAFQVSKNEMKSEDRDDARFARAAVENYDNID